MVLRAPGSPVGYTLTGPHNRGANTDGFGTGRAVLDPRSAHARPKGGQWRPRFGSAVSETSTVPGSKPSRASSSRIRARWSPWR